MWAYKPNLITNLTYLHPTNPHIQPWIWYLDRISVSLIIGHNFQVSSKCQISQWVISNTFGYHRGPSDIHWMSFLISKADIWKIQISAHHWSVPYIILLLLVFQLLPSFFWILLGLTLLFFLPMDLTLTQNLIVGSSLH